MDYKNMKNILTVVMLVMMMYHLGLTISHEQQLQQQYVPQEYLTNLTSIEDNFTAQIQALNQQMDKINQIISSKQETKKTKIIQLSESLADQRSSLYDIQQSLKIPYELAICSCLTITGDEKQQLLQKIQKIKEQIKRLNETFEDCSGEDCAKTVELKQSTKIMQNYLNSLEEVVDKQCCRGEVKLQKIPDKTNGFEDITNSLYIDNLNTIWSDRIKDKQYSLTLEYKSYIFQLTTKFNVTKCPQKRPFALHETNTCSSCITKTQFLCFSLNRSRCQECEGSKIMQICLEENYYFDFQLEQCKICPQNSYVNHNDSLCIACDVDHGQFLNTSKQQCQKCPQQQEYIKSKQQCLPCNSLSFFNETTFKCQECRKGKYYDKTNEECQFCPGKRYYSQQKQSCVRCPNNTQLNESTLECDPCKEHQHYNQTIGICFLCKQGSVYNETSNKCDADMIHATCPSDNPHYNAYEHKCESCPVGQVYDKDLQRCLRVNNIGICPPNKPLYNYKVHRCEQCPEGTQYNKYFYECDPIKPSETTVQTE